MWFSLQLVGGKWLLVVILLRVHSETHTKKEEILFSVQPGVANVLFQIKDEKICTFNLYAGWNKKTIEAHRVGARVGA